MYHTGCHSSIGEPTELIVDGFLSPLRDYEWCTDFIFWERPLASESNKDKYIQVAVLLFEYYGDDPRVSSITPYSVGSSSIL